MANNFPLILFILIQIQNTTSNVGCCWSKCQFQFVLRQFTCSTLKPQEIRKLLKWMVLYSCLELVYHHSLHSVFKKKTKNFSICVAIDKVLGRQSLLLLNLHIDFVSKASFTSVLGNEVAFCYSIGGVSTSRIPTCKCSILTGGML